MVERLGPTAETVRPPLHCLAKAQQPPEVLPEPFVDVAGVAAKLEHRLQPPLQGKLEQPGPDAARQQPLLLVVRE